VLLTRKTAPARRFGDAMAASSRKGPGMGTPKLFFDCGWSLFLIVDGLELETR
jgi:hypothetical protein